MLKTEIYNTCKIVAPKYKFEPQLILAICAQESQDQKVKDACDEYATRMENGFLNKYTRKFELATTTECSLAISYGLMQLMGQSLNEMHYFEWFRKWYNSQHPTGTLLLEELSEITVCKGINHFMMNPQWHVEWGVKWLDRKRSQTKDGSTEEMLLRWNGGGNEDYADEVLKHYKEIKKVFT